MVKHITESLPCKHKAFSLPELLLTMAIIGVLSALAVTSYKDYITRGKVMDVIGTASGHVNLLKRGMQDGTFAVSHDAVWYNSIAAPTTLISHIGILDGNGTSGCPGVWIYFNRAAMGWTSFDYDPLFAYKVCEVNGALVTYCGLNCSYSSLFKYFPQNCQQCL